MGKQRKPRQPTKRVCAICGDVFWSAGPATKFCPSCAEFRRRNRCGVGAVHINTKLTGNMAAIERANREAEAQGLSYGKLEGKRYAEKHVQVMRRGEQL